MNFKQLQAKRDGKSILGTNVLLPGYPGLTHTAHLIAEYIPKCKIYVEPFAGLGRTVPHINAERVILNDKSDYAFDYLSKHFHAEITNLDFEEMFRLYDSKDTVFLIDPPWREKIYEVNSGPVLDRKPIEYYQKIFEITPKLKGDWFLCSDKDEHEIRKICTKTAKERGYHTKKIDSRKKLFKKPIGTLVTTNKPFTRHQQQELFTQ